jgi:hypothetical protein
MEPGLVAPSTYERFLRMRGAQQHVRLELHHDAIGLVAQD